VRNDSCPRDESSTRQVACLRLLSAIRELSNVTSLRPLGVEEEHIRRQTLPEYRCCLFLARAFVFYDCDTAIGGAALDSPVFHLALAMGKNYCIGSIPWRDKKTRNQNANARPKRMSTTSKNLCLIRVLQCRGIGGRVGPGSFTPSLSRNRT
jgi:hypothetical protein